MSIKNHLINFRKKINTKEPNSILLAISFFALCLLMADCAFSGAGKWISLGPISFRMIMGAVAGICALPMMIRNLKKWIKSPIVLSLIIFIVYLIVCAALGVARGNRTDIILSDIKGFSWLVLVPIALSAVTSEKRLHIIMKCVIIGAVLQALFMITINIMYIYSDGLYVLTRNIIFNKLFGFTDDISATMVRIFTRSSPYLAVSIIFLTYFQMRKLKFSWLISFAAALCFNAILLTFTRSLYAASAVAIIMTAVLFAFLFKNKWKRLILHIFITVALAIIIVFGQQWMSGASYIKFALYRTLSIDVVESDVVESDNDTMGENASTSDTLKESNQQQQYIENTKISDNVVRKETLYELKASIGKNPFFGNGLGSTIDYREDGYVEYFYHDIVNKMGFLGLAFYCFPIIYMAYFAIRKIIMKDIKNSIIGTTWLTALSVFFIITFFNPYMNSTLGIACYSLAISCFAMIDSGKGKELIPTAKACNAPEIKDSHMSGSAKIIGNSVNKISIAMATYNGQQYITRQLDSIRNQTRAADEVIIFDDCSSDNTAVLIGAYIKKHKLANWHLHINKENVGYKKNFYKSIKETTGDIIFLSDQDDIWHVDKLEKMIKLFEAHSDMQVLNTSFSKIDEDGKALNIKRRFNRSNHNLITGRIDSGALKKYYLDTILWRNISPGCTAAFTKRCKELFVDSYTGICSHDWEINIFGAILGGLYFSNQELTDYRMHKNNTVGLPELPLSMRFAKRDTELLLSNAIQDIQKTRAFLDAKWQDDLSCNEKQVFIKYKKFIEKRLFYIKRKSIPAFINLCFYMPVYIKSHGLQGVFDDMKICLTKDKLSAKD